VAPPKLTLYNLNDSLASRAKILRQLVWSKEAGLQNPQVLFIARQVTRACYARDAICELRAIFQFTVKNVRYTGDIAGADTFSAPLRTLEMGGEDCDGHAVLNAALAIANGFRAKFRITSNRGNTWDHIYCMAGTNPKGSTNEWVALDTTLARGRDDISRFRTEPPRAKFQDFVIAGPNDY
jgi:hypothetical protein